MKISKFLLLSLTTLALQSSGFGQTNTFPSSGNVGIGTTNPSSKIDVVADMGNDPQLK